MTTPITSWIADLWQGMAVRPWLAAVAAGVVVAGVFGRDRLHAWRHRRHTRNAQRVTIAAPPEVTPESAAQFWATMVGVLTPSMWRRRVFGTPHVAWEYTWTGRRLSIRLWVPGTVPPGAVPAAVRAAWPAATVTVDDAVAPVPTTVVDAVGGAHRPQQVDVLPLRFEHDSDPLRALLAAGAQVRDREHACVQILARPAPARRVRAARRAAATPAGTARPPQRGLQGADAAALGGMAQRP